MGVGEVIFAGVAMGGGCSDGGAAGVGETEDLGDLIKTFADGVVASGADDLEFVVVGHVDDLGVAARDDEGENREFRRFFGVEPACVEV